MLKDVFDKEEKFFQCRLRVERLFERSETEHGYQLLARTYKRAVSVGIRYIRDTNIKITSAIAVMNPCNIARLSTTSTNPSRKKPSKNDISPDCDIRPTFRHTQTERYPAMWRTWTVMTVAIAIFTASGLSIGVWGS